jgi:hypothetical protein
VVEHLDRHSMKGFKAHGAFDLDDCVVDFTNGIDACVKKEYGIELQRTDPWDTTLYEPFGGSKGFWKWLRKRDWLWATFDAVDGAIGTIDRLRDAGLYCEAVTSKPEWAEPQVWQWLGKWRVPFHRVTIMDSTKKQTKHESTEADFLMDDKLETCKAWAQTGRVAFFYDPWWRLEDPFPENMLPIRSWADAFDTISEAYLEGDSSDTRPIRGKGQRRATKVR